MKMCARCGEVDISDRPKQARYCIPCGKARTKERWREKYHNDTNFRDAERARTSANGRKRYRDDPEYREHKITQAKLRNAKPEEVLSVFART